MTACNLGIKLFITGVGVGSGHTLDILSAVNGLGLGLCSHNAITVVTDVIVPIVASFAKFEKGNFSLRNIINVMIHMCLF